MTSGRSDRIELLQGTLDLIVLRALATMGPQHAYGLAARLEQKGWIRESWNKTETNREAKFYAITRAGTRALRKQTERCRRLAGSSTDSSWARRDRVADPPVGSAAVQLPASFAS